MESKRFLAEKTSQLREFFDTYKTPTNTINAEKNKIVWDIFLGLENINNHVTNVVANEECIALK